MYNKEKTEQALERIHDVVEKLLDPETGCSWDREQNPISMAEYIIEECFECIDAIRSNKTGHIVDEMGDLLFNVYFVAHLFAKEGKFDFADALNSASAKMIRRHPHVFADAKIESRQDLIDNWARIKKEEKEANKDERKGVFSTLVREVPPLTKAYRIHSKAAQAGFTWENDEDVEQQVEAEYLELFDALQEKNQEKIEHEIGDMVFSLVELGRRKGIKLANATDFATNRFLDRFEAMEKLALLRGLNFEELTLDEKDALWTEVKQGNV